MADFLPASPHKPAEPPSPLVNAVVRQYLTAEEAAQIHRQFQQAFPRNKQVLWTGMIMSEARKWADHHEMQTLTTAMGPLMNPDHPKCLQREKSKKAWSKYVHGASAVFAWYISGGDVVTLLTQPPPDRFNPHGAAYYQIIEEPIVTGKIGGRCVGQIQVVHPAVTQAVDFSYQMWPVDEVHEWNKRYGKLRVVNPRWRKIRGQQEVTSANPVAGSKAVLGKESKSTKTSSKEIQESAPKPKQKSKAKGTSDGAAKPVKSGSSKTIEPRAVKKCPTEAKTLSKAKKQQNGSSGAHTEKKEKEHKGNKLQMSGLLANNDTGKKKKCKRKKKRQRNKSCDIETRGG